MCYNISTGYLTPILEGYTCMISPADFVSCPTKVTWPTAFFLQKKTFFVQLSSRPSAGQPAGWHMDSCVKIKYIYIYIYI